MKILQIMILTVLVFITTGCDNFIIPRINNNYSDPYMKIVMDSINNKNIGLYFQSIGSNFKIFSKNNNNNLVMGVILDSNQTYKFDTQWLVFKKNSNKFLIDTTIVIYSESNSKNGYYFTSYIMNNKFKIETDNNEVICGINFNIKFKEWIYPGDTLVIYPRKLLMCDNQYILPDSINLHY